MMKEAKFLLRFGAITIASFVGTGMLILAGTAQGLTLFG
jgi:hypothetical protein